MGAKQRRSMAEQLSCILDAEERIIIATGRYLGERFDDARLDTLFLTMPISWKSTLAQCAGRPHRLHANKKEVLIYDYEDLNVLCWPGCTKSDSKVTERLDTPEPSHSTPITLSLRR